VSVIIDFDPYRKGVLSAEDRALEALGRAHEQEADRCGAEFYNFGWVNGENSITSKTSEGILDSEMDPATMKVIHHWTSWKRYKAQMRFFEMRQFFESLTSDEMGRFFKSLTPDTKKRFLEMANEQRRSGN
jgi:hypothetical protein